MTTRHAHPHTHADGSQHSGWHHHAEDLWEITMDDRTHAREPHEHEHHPRKVTVELTFDVGTLDDLGYGGFKQTWIDAQKPDGTELSLTCGAGLGSPLIEASVTGPDGAPDIYARVDIRAMVTQLWQEMERLRLEHTSTQEAPDGA